MTTAAAVTEVDLHIKSRLVAARLMRGLSEEELAQELNVTHAQIREYERGHDVLTAGRVFDIAQALGINVSFFYEGLSEAISCPYSLSEERYGVLRRAVQRIAADHEFTAGGCRKKLSLHMAMEIARSVCDALGWSYLSQSAVDPTLAPVAEGAEPEVGAVEVNQAPNSARAEREFAKEASFTP